MKQDKNWWREPLLFSGRISGWIAGPILIALFLGRYLDKKYDTEPVFFLGLTAVAFIISCVGLVRTTLGYIKSLGNKSGENKENSHD